MSAALAHPRAALRELDRLDCEASHLVFSRRFFEEREGSPFLVGPHHKVMCRTLDRVLAGEIQRLIINVPPGYTKTELAVVYFVARGLAKNARARFIHASFNGPLALENSNKVRDVIGLEGYRGLWPRKIRDDTNAKGLWRTEEGGGLMAAAAGGPITGFRAGRMEDGFTGALVIDDPLKPDDAKSDVERENINGRWHSTFKSRLAREDVPVVVIMQRLHVDDFSGYLLKGGAGVRWHHLMLPVWIDNGEAYPDEYTHGIPVPHGLPDGPLWAAKHTAAQVEILKADAYTYAGQYAQRPVVAGGNLFKTELFGRHKADELPALVRRAIYVDTAQKTKERHDYSVFQVWGLGRDGRAYLLDLVRGKFEAPELEKTARALWAKHKAVQPTTVHGHLAKMQVEDKVSGTGLIQSIRRPPNPIPVIGVERDKDKYTRALDAIPSIAAGLVSIPAAAPWLTAFLAEVAAFPNGAHDDQVDPMVDAIVDLVGNSVSVEDVL